MKIGDIVRINWLPDSRKIITSIDGIFFLLDDSDIRYFESELEIEIHEDQIKINKRNSKIEQLLEE